MNIQTPAARNTDPVTSHLAIEQMNKSGNRVTQQDLVRNIVEDMPGKTAAEYAQELQKRGHDLEHVQVQRRLSDLDFLAVEKGERRKCSVKGSKMVTWRPIHG